MNFIMFGPAGYVAPKHMQAIKENNGELIGAIDPHDSVGVLDNYFPECNFFTEFERFIRYCSKTKVDFVTVCSPNYLHDPHCRFGLSLGANVICEKPVALTIKNLDSLQEQEVKFGKKIYSILQLRLNPDLQKLKDEISGSHRVILDYYTPRGNWYKHSWKGNVRKSGGLATNIGIHMFDLMSWLFGPEMEEPIIYQKTSDTVEGFLEFERATVKFELSIDKRKKPLRKMVIDGQEIEFSNNFHNLHSLSYEMILQGMGFGLDEARPSIELCEKIRNSGDDRRLR